MTDKLKTGIYLPVWALGLLVSIIMAIFSWGIATASTSATIKAQTVTNKENNDKQDITLRRLEDIKANVKDIDEIKADLKEIKTLLLNRPYNK